MIEQSRKNIEYKKDDIVYYLYYNADLINDPTKKPTPNKLFKVISVDMDWGVVNYGEDTIGIAYIRKATFIERIRYKLFW